MSLNCQHHVCAVSVAHLVMAASHILHFSYVLFPVFGKFCHFLVQISDTGTVVETPLVSVDIGIGIILA